MTADRWGPHRVLAVVLVSIMVSIAALLLTEATGLGLVAAAVFVVLWGIASNGVMQLTPMLLVEHMGLRSFATLMGVAGLIIGIAAALGPSVAGTVFDLTGTYTAAFALCAICVLLSAASLARLWHTTLHGQVLPQQMHRSV
jgi:nitrate/nitrite transporter NarK